MFATARVESDIVRGRLLLLLLVYYVLILQDFYDDYYYCHLAELVPHTIPSCHLKGPEPLHCRPQTMGPMLIAYPRYSLPRETPP